MPPHPLTNFEIRKHHHDESKFNDAYSRNNLSKTKDRKYVMDPDEYESIGTHSMTCIVIKSTDVTYFDSFRVGHVLTKIKKFMGNRNTATNGFRIQA